MESRPNVNRKLDLAFLVLALVAISVQLPGLLKRAEVADEKSPHSIPTTGDHHDYQIHAVNLLHRLGFAESMSLPLETYHLDLTAEAGARLQQPSATGGKRVGEGSDLLEKQSHRDWRLDGRVRIIADQFEILVFEFVNVFHRGVELHLRQRTRFARELQLRLFQVIGVEVKIAKGVHEGAGFQLADLGDHQRQQRVGGDVERHPEEQVGAALIELAAQSAVLHEKLEQGMAGGQGHRFDLTHVPGADDVPAAVGIFPDPIDDPVDLVDGAAVRGAPVAPLRAVDAAQVTVLVGPLVPDADPVFVEVFDIRVAAEEPQQFVNDGFDVELLGGEQGKTFGQREARLGAESRQGTGAGAVGFELSLVQDQPKQFVILQHRSRLPIRLV